MFPFRGRSKDKRETTKFWGCPIVKQAHFETSLQGREGHARDGNVRKPIAPTYHHPNQQLKEWCFSELVELRPYLACFLGRREPIVWSLRLAGSSQEHWASPEEKEEFSAMFWSETATSWLIKSRGHASAVTLYGGIFHGQSRSFMPCTVSSAGVSRFSGKISGQTDACRAELCWRVGMPFFLVPLTPATCCVLCIPWTLLFGASPIGTCRGVEELGCHQICCLYSVLGRQTKRWRVLSLDNPDYRQRVMLFRVMVC